MQQRSSADKYLARASQMMAGTPEAGEPQMPEGGMGGMPRPSDGPPPSGPHPNSRLSIGGDGLDYMDQVRANLAAREKEKAEEEQARKRAEAVQTAKKAGFRPSIEKGEFQLGKPGQAKSGHKVQQLASAEQFPELHATIKALLDQRPGKSLKGPTVQMAAAAHDIKLSNAQATRLARRIMRAKAETPSADRFAMAGAKAVLNRGA